MSEYGPGVYDVLDSGSTAGAAAAAQGASMMFEYNWFKYGADYRFREFEDHRRAGGHHRGVQGWG